jgi:hypothetical protein
MVEVLKARHVDDNDLILLYLHLDLFYLSIIVPSHTTATHTNTTSTTMSAPIEVLMCEFEARKKGVQPNRELMRSSLIDRLVMSRWYWRGETMQSKSDGVYLWLIPSLLSAATSTPPDGPDRVDLNLTKRSVRGRLRHSPLTRPLTWNTCSSSSS